MTIDDKIGDEKLQYNINREAAKISALSYGKIDKVKKKNTLVSGNAGARKIFTWAAANLFFLIN